MTSYLGRDRLLLLMRKRLSPENAVEKVDAAVHGASGKEEGGNMGTALEPGHIVGDVVFL